MIAARLSDCGDGVWRGWRPSRFGQPIWEAPRHSVGWPEISQGVDLVADRMAPTAWDFVRVFAFLLFVASSVLAAGAVCGGSLGRCLEPDFRVGW